MEACTVAAAGAMSGVEVIGRRKNDRRKAAGKRAHLGQWVLSNGRFFLIPST